MAVELRPITPFRPSQPVIDVHGHGFKDPAGLQALATRYSIPLYGRGTAQEAAETMAENGIRWRVLKNLAAKPGSVKKANDFAIEVAREHAKLLPTGTIHLNYPENEAEVERLAEAGVRGIAFDSTWQGFDVCNQGLREVYKKVSQYRMFIIAHCGIDPIGAYPNRITWTEHMLSLKEMVPDSPVIATHLGAFGRFERAREYQGADILLDIAFIREAINGRVASAPPRAEDIADSIYLLGEDRLVCGFDYPWADPGANLAYWEPFFSDTTRFSSEAWVKISHQNAARALGIQV